MLSLVASVLSRIIRHSRPSQPPWLVRSLTLIMPLEGFVSRLWSNNLRRVFRWLLPVSPSSCKRGMEGPLGAATGSLTEAGAVEVARILAAVEVARILVVVEVAPTMVDAAHMTVDEIGANGASRTLQAA